MVVVANSYLDLADITARIEEVLAKGNLELSKTKSVIMTSRNTN
jgi:hypothetical protein